MPHTILLSSEYLLTNVTWPTLMEYSRCVQNSKRNFLVSLDRFVRPHFICFYKLPPFWGYILYPVITPNVTAAALMKQLERNVEVGLVWSGSVSVERKMTMFFEHRSHSTMYFNV